MKGFLFYFFTLTASFALGQKGIQPFLLAPADGVIPHAKYNAISLLDVRKDTTQLGVVQLGAFNKKAKVVAEIPLQQQLSSLLATMTDATAAPEEMVLLLRKFIISETTGGMSEQGFCVMRAAVFQKTNEGYLLVDTINRNFVISSLDVTKATLRKGSELFREVLAKNLQASPRNNHVYQYNDLLRFDSVEKAAIPLFANTTYKNGLYRTYADFAAQTPSSEQIELRLDKDSSVKNVYILDEKGERIKQPAKEIYAVVYNNQPYVATAYGFYLLQKRENDFYFSGTIKIPATNSDVAAASLMFGILGGMIASGGSSGHYEVKLDYVNGNFIRIKELKK